VIALQEQVVELDLADYARDADEHEIAALAGVEGPVLDVGSGPGRMVVALAARGVPALGIDVAPLALEYAARRDAPTLSCSVFERVPGEGRWPTILLFDGNIGIGGDPAGLLRRVRQLLRPDGVAIVELEAPGVESHRSVARLELGTGVTGWLPWARVGVDDIERLALAVGLRATGTKMLGSRWFGWLRRPTPQS
jgi:SAM-dependent methyltransferase